MIRIVFAVILMAAVLATPFGFGVRAQSVTEPAATQQVRKKVEEIGAGSHTRVKVKLRDTTQLEGYIQQANNDSFTVFDNKTGTTDTVAYADAMSVKKAGGGISSKTWIILGASAVGAIVTWAIVKPAFCDGGAQTRGIC